MAHNNEMPNSGYSVSPNVAQENLPLRGKGRKFFQQMQPTFAVDLPATNTRLQFLDDNDPAKDTVVRKKAREWVNMNKKMNKQDAGKRRIVRRKEILDGFDENQASDGQLQIRRSSHVTSIGRPASRAASFQLDPLYAMPDVGRDYRHIVDFFLNGGCPDQVPCSDDKYAQKAHQGLIVFSRENTVIGNMKKSDFTFMLWLYATLVMRNGMMGLPQTTEESRWFYNKALKSIQSMLKKDAEAGKYSDELQLGLACITATAAFSGMFDTASLHRDAMLRILTIRGDGDIMEGIRSTPPFVGKASQWCEMMVAAQLVQASGIPYYHAVPCLPLPDKLAREAERRTTKTLSQLPQLSEPLQYIVGLLHQLGAAHANPDPSAKIDSYIIRSMYDAEYTILQVLETQKISGSLSETEALLAETFQTYFWAGLRELSPRTRLAEVFVARIMSVTLPFVLKGVSKNMQFSPETARQFASAFPVPPSSVPRTLSSSDPTNNVIAWCLAIATKYTSTSQPPQYLWLKGYLRLHMQATGLGHDEEAFRRVIDIFPTTDGFPLIALGELFKELHT